MTNKIFIEDLVYIRVIESFKGMSAKTKEIVGDAVEKLVEEIKRLDLVEVKGDFDTGDDEDFM